MIRWTNKSYMDARKRGIGPKDIPGHLAGRDNMAGTAMTQHSRPMAADDLYRARQEAGLAALLRIAILERGEQAGRRQDEFPTHATRVSAPSGRMRRMILTLRRDHLVRNSLYLMLSTGIQAALGFTFWIIMARLFSTGDVGKASSLISATALIAYFALFGLNSTLVRFLPGLQKKVR